MLLELLLMCKRNVNKKMGNVRKWKIDFIYKKSPNHFEILERISRKFKFVIHSMFKKKKKIYK